MTGRMEFKMRLYPAIDIKNGLCVRLRQGNFNDKQVYSEQPAEVAKRWESMGAEFIHVVDLDGALEGSTKNKSTIESIVKSVNIPVQLGGGIRDDKTVRDLLDIGVNRVIIGTKAVENPEYIRELIHTNGSERIVIGIDAKNGMVAVQGWEIISNRDAVSLALLMKNMGVKTIIYTDISKDGMLQGPNVEATQKLVEATGMDIIASGGVSTMKDLENLSLCGVEGAIIGKALYENRIDLSEAVKAFQI